MLGEYIANKVKKHKYLVGTRSGRVDATYDPLEIVPYFKYCKG